MNTATRYARLNITIPKSLAVTLKETTTNISKFITVAVTERIAQERRLKAIEELAKLPPAFPEIKNSAKYIHDMRRNEMKKRDKKLGLS